MCRMNDLVDQNPQKLIRLLQIVAMVSTCLILVASILGTHWLYRGYVEKVSRDDAIRISELIVAIESRFLLPSEDLSRSALLLTDTALTELDMRMDRFLSPHGVLKVKVFSLDGRVLYSTDRSIIGRSDAGNPNLLKALAGTVHSELLTKESFQDISSETRFDVDVVETYVPIVNPAGQVLGCFEIYQDTTAYRSEVLKGVIMSVGVLALVLVAVFSIAYGFLRTAVRRLLQAQERLHYLAIRDSLTGLFNRREIALQGAKEFDRYRRQSVGAEYAPFSVMMIDIDNFKAINDTYGHVTGDQILRLVAQYLSEEMRSYSLVGRYGGEEFVVVLPGGGTGDARAAAERIRSGIAERSLACNGCETQVTISIGTTVVSDEDRMFEDTVDRADRALYLAKGQGKNQVVIF